MKSNHLLNNTHTHTHTIVVVSVHIQYQLFGTTNLQEKVFLSLVIKTPWRNLMKEALEENSGPSLCSLLAVILHYKPHQVRVSHA